jgi:hypothetical protein
MVKFNSHDLLQIDLNNSEILISGSEEAPVKMDVTHTSFALQMNFDKVYKKAYDKCRSDTFCNFYLGSEIELINKIALDYIGEDGNTSAANEFMERAIAGNYPDFYRQVFTSIKKNIDELGL